MCRRFGNPIHVGRRIHNGCIFHYVENDKQKLKWSTVTHDLGAEWKGYTADVTRQTSRYGKFNEEEPRVYELVPIKPRNWDWPYVPGQVLGISMLPVEKSSNDGPSPALGNHQGWRKSLLFRMGTSHHLGIRCTWSRRSWASLKREVVLKVEPGIYIPEGSKMWIANGGE